jgi:gamma-glutamyl:cysteine ligase YbdK (ATP-grasp superfamily)
MAGNFAAPKIRDENHFYEIAVESGFVNDPRRCWWLIRVNGVGTVELRFFDSTNDVSLIVSFAREIQAMLS